MLSWTKHPSATSFMAQAQGNNNVIWLLVLLPAALLCLQVICEKPQYIQPFCQQTALYVGMKKVKLFISAWKINMFLLKQPEAEIQTKLNGLADPAELQNTSLI